MVRCSSGPCECRWRVALRASNRCPSRAAEPRKPDCEALEEWALTIDDKARAIPIDGSRAWIPQAMLDPAFAELFELPALEWTYDSAQDVGAHIYECGQAAGRAGRRDGRNTLYALRGYVISNLRGVLTQHARAEAAAQQAAEREEQRREREAAAADLAAKRLAERERREAELRTQRTAEARTRADA